MFSSIQKFLFLRHGGQLILVSHITYCSYPGFRKISKLMSVIFVSVTESDTLEIDRHIHFCNMILKKELTSLGIIRIRNYLKPFTCYEQDISPKNFRYFSFNIS